MVPCQRYSSDAHLIKNKIVSNLSFIFELSISWAGLMALFTQLGSVLCQSLFFFQSGDFSDFLSGNCFIWWNSAHQNLIRYWHSTVWKFNELEWYGVAVMRVRPHADLSHTLSLAFAILPLCRFSSPWDYSLKSQMKCHFRLLIGLRSSHLIIIFFVLLTADLSRVEVARKLNNEAGRFFFSRKKALYISNLP